jgi:glutamate dehydrogenase
VSVEALPAVAPEDAPPDALVEEWMRLDLDPISTDENEDLEAELSEVLRAVREVAEDREEIAATVQHVAAELLERPGSSGDERPDAARLLQWLHDGRFLFMGYRRHEVDRRTGSGAVPGSGLGVLRRADVPDGVPGELAVDAGARPPVVLTRPAHRAGCCVRSIPTISAS